MKTLFLGAMLLCSGALLAPLTPLQAQTVSKTASSDLAGIPLPSQTLRFAPDSVPAEISNALQTMMNSGGDKVKRGRTEVLGWSGDGYKKSRAKEFKTRIATALKKAGWEYEEGQRIEGAQGTTMVSAVRTVPTRKALIGFWAPTDEALLLAWTEMLPANGPIEANVEVARESATSEATTTEEAPTVIPTATETAEANEAIEATPQANTTALGTVITLTDDQIALDAGEGLPAPRVTFPALKPKPGKVCGYVKSSDGTPLKGAVIGVSSTAVGGGETSIEAKSDEKGYYEAFVPFGGARFYASGYTAKYGAGLLALGLTPADGEADTFATPKGHVENWILKPYGLADAAGAQDNPRYLNNYFGGGISLQYLDEYSGYAGPKGLPFGSTVDVTFTPKSLFDGSKGKSFTIRKVIKEEMQHRVNINDIPIGLYTLAVRINHKGRTTSGSFKETGPDRMSSFGITPKEAQGSVDLAFLPYSARASSATAGKGNWKEVEIYVMQ